MSLLTMIQATCDNLGLPRPAAVISTTDQQVRQILALANQEGLSLSRRAGVVWSAFQKEATHTTLAAELQGTLASIVGTSFDYIIPETFYDRSSNRAVSPMSPIDWQVYKSSGITGPYPQFRIKDKSLYALPTPTAGHTWAFEYVSKNWCQNAAGDTTYSAWNADTDTGILDEFIMQLGIQWRWLKRKGFDYGEDFDEYERAVQDAVARDGAKKRLLFSHEPGRRLLDENSVQEGSWTL